MDVELKAWSLLLILWVSVSCDALTKNYCQNEVLDARCQEDEVVVIQNATYGRMRITECISKNYGYLGCGTDVTGASDAMCSGRQTCDIRVPNEMFDAAPKSCPDDFKKYLEASYTCEKVFLPVKSKCRSQRSVSLTNQYGVLASAVTIATKCGSPSAPYIVEAKPGQTINFTLIDFAYYTRQNVPQSPNSCEAYATFKESTESNGVPSETLCGASFKQSEVYTSKTHRVQVTIIDRSEPRYFLLKYQINGCATPPQPPNSWSKRSGDEATIHCNHSSVSYSLKCVNGSWLGKTMNCSGAVSTGGLQFADGLAMNYELAVVLIVAIALVIACCILCVGVVWMKSKRPAPPQGPQRQADIYYDGQQEYSEQRVDGYNRKEQELMWNYDPYRGENVYASIQDAPTLYRAHQPKTHLCEAGVPVMPEVGLHYDQNLVPCFSQNAPDNIMTDSNHGTALRQYFVVDPNRQRKDSTPEHL